jgi:hypothetical protein
LANVNFFLPISLIFLINWRIFERVGGYHFFGRKGGGPPLFLTYDPLWRERRRERERESERERERERNPRP